MQQVELAAAQYVLSTYSSPCFSEKLFIQLFLETAGSGILLGGEVWRRAKWTLDSSIIAVLEAAKTCSYKKDDEPLLNLTGAMSPEHLLSHLLWGETAS